ncbi:MAG: hypothetical protein GTO14_00480 [Anaerolineales bacterium]|nr:hypothetical protein [Anaerolineales bacterium]
MSHRRDRASEKGQATLEFLIIVPFILVLIALVGFAGWWSYARLSAQNAAYGWAVWNAFNKPDASGPKISFGIAGNPDARTATLHSPLGMKEMWGDTVGDIEPHFPNKYWRKGGTSVVIWIAPGDIPFNKALEIMGGNASGRVPRGTAFFFYGPFNSARE